MNSVDLPKSIIARIAKEKTGNMIISSEAKVAITKAVSVFIAYEAGLANEIAKENSRNTVVTKDILQAIEESELGFAPPLKKCLEEYREHEEQKKRQQKKAEADAAAAGKKKKKDAEANPNPAEAVDPAAAADAVDHAAAEHPAVKKRKKDTLPDDANNSHNDGNDNSNNNDRSNNLSADNAAD